MLLTAKATMAVARARKPYLAMPSERPTKVLAMPNMILHSATQTMTAPAPTRIMELRRQKASTCRPTAARYRAAALLAASMGRPSPLTPWPSGASFDPPLVTDLTPPTSRPCRSLASGRAVVKNREEEEKKVGEGVGEWAGMGVRVGVGSARRAAAGEGEGWRRRRRWRVCRARREEERAAAMGSNRDRVRSRGQLGEKPEKSEEGLNGRRLWTNKRLV